jgi:hypothetical protein
MNETRYPLCWPQNWKRTTSRTGAQFGKTETQYVEGIRSYAGKSRLSMRDAIDRIADELRLMGVKEENCIVSTNIPLNLSGVPRGDRGEPSDPGAAIYWTHKGKSQCMAIDRYTRVADNLAAIAATLGALRAVERHGGGSILERAFIGFAALPSSAQRPWREVLVFGDRNPGREEIEQRFRSMAKQLHPDKNGGDAEGMIELNAARAEALRELNRGSDEAH